MNPTGPKARAWAQPGQEMIQFLAIRWVKFLIIIFAVRLFLGLVIADDGPA
jgi:hypothetical protein